MFPWLAAWAIIKRRGTIPNRAALWGWISAGPLSRSEWLQRHAHYTFATGRPQATRDAPAVANNN